MLPVEDDVHLLRVIEAAQVDVDDFGFESLLHLADREDADVYTE